MGVFKLTFKSDFEPISEGVHTAVCDKVIDLGEQVGSEEFGSKISRQVYIGWQVTDDGDEAKTIGKIYNVASGPRANLRKDLEAWRGRPFAEEDEFDSDSILGKGCLLQVTATVNSQGKKRSRITGIMSLPRGTQTEPPAETLSWELNEFTWDQIDPRIPEWIVNVIKEGITYKQLSEPQTAEDVFGAAPEDNSLGELPEGF